jgi:hypothetical protein
VPPYLAVKQSWKRGFLTGLALWLVFTTSLVTIAVWSKPVQRAVLIMGWGLIILWIYVYGLMLYLPAYCLPRDRPAREVRWWHYPLAVIVPFLFEVLVPTGLLIKLISPDHPKIHFPPIL